MLQNQWRCSALRGLFTVWGSLSAFLHWRVDATAIIGTLTQRTAVADRNRRFNAFAWWLPGARSALLDG